MTDTSPARYPTPYGSAPPYIPYSYRPAPGPGATFGPPPIPGPPPVPGYGPHPDQRPLYPQYPYPPAPAAVPRPAPPTALAGNPDPGYTPYSYTSAPSLAQDFDYRRRAGKRIYVPFWFRVAIAGRVAYVALSLILGITFAVVKACHHHPSPPPSHTSSISTPRQSNPPAEPSSNPPGERVAVTAAGR